MMNGANVPLRRLPVHHLPVMLPQHLQGVVGFSKPAANATSLLAAQRRARVTGGRELDARSRDRVSFERIRERSKRMNSCSPACFNSLGFRLQFERGVRVRRFVECILAGILPFPSLILGYVNEFVCQQPKISRAIQANNDAMPRRQTVVSAERGKGRSFRRSSFEVRPTRIDINSLRLEEKAASAILRSDLGFDRCAFLREVVRFGDSGLVLIRGFAQTRRSLDRRSMA